MAKRILIADDSVTIQKAFAMTFAGEDVSIASARSADEGLALARQARPDLIIADGAMPGRTGYDLCAQVRADAALSGVPVYILASGQQPYDEARGTSAGRRRPPAQALGHLGLHGKGATRLLEASSVHTRLAPPARATAASLPASAMERRLRRDQHRFVRPRDAASDRHRRSRPWPLHRRPSAVVVPGGCGAAPAAPAMRPSLDSRHAPRRHAARPSRHHAGSPARRPGQRRRRACRRVPRRRRSDGR